MASLRVYSESNDREYVVIVTDEKEVAELTEGDKLELEVELPIGNYIAFPTDRILRAE